VAREPFIAVTGSLYFIGEVLERLETIYSDESKKPSGPMTTNGAGTNQRQLNEWAPPP
jgi:hypothetical protein